MHAVEFRFAGARMRAQWHPASGSTDVWEAIELRDADKVQIEVIADAGAAVNVDVSALKRRLGTEFLRSILRDPNVPIRDFKRDETAVERAKTLPFFKYARGENAPNNTAMVGYLYFGESKIPFIAQAKTNKGTMMPISQAANLAISGALSRLSVADTVSRRFTLVIVGSSTETAPFQGPFAIVLPDNERIAPFWDYVVDNTPPGESVATTISAILQKAHANLLAINAQEEVVAEGASPTKIKTAK